MLYSDLPVVDQQAICRTLRLPIPTPDVSLDVIIFQEKLTPCDVLTRLERSRHLNAQIAAAALRGTVTLCPPDKRLHPDPYPKAPVARPRTPREAKRQLPQPSPTLKATQPRRLASFVDNPKRPGSAARDRYALYQIGKTEAELLALGLWRADLRHDTAHNFITWSQ